MSAALLRANALALPLADDSVDLIVTSPPYFALRSYADGGEHYDGQIGSEDTPKAFLAALWAVMDECWRVLKPSGSCWVNLGDKFATKSRMLLPHRFAEGCIDPEYRRWVTGYDHPEHQWICRMDAVWSKPNGMPESVTDRVRASHEYWFHLTRSERYYAAIDEIREPHSGGSNHGRNDGGNGPSHHKLVAKGERGGVMGGTNPDLFNPLGKLPGSVWTVPSEPLTVPDWVGVDHFAAFPTEFPRRIILGWSPSGICTACGEGREPVRGRRCECGGIIKAHAKTCGQCGARPGAGGKWKEGRGGDAQLMTDAHKPGTHAQRLPGGFSDQSVSDGYSCACPAPDAPTSPAVILDPFGGTGTTAMIARALGRHGISVDLSADYLRLADWRIHRSGHWAKAVERTTGRPCTPDQPIPGQATLFP